MRQIEAIVVVAVLVLAGVVLLRALRRITIPQQQLLCQLQPVGQEVSFVCPKGHHFNLVIGMPRNRTNAEVGRSGKLSLSVGTNLVAELPFDTRKSTKANWLDKVDLDAYVVTLPVNDSPKHLDQWLKDSAMVTIHTETTVALGEMASLWLTYLARWVDLKKAKLTVSHSNGE